jgi:hypothetical protein
MEGNIMKPAAFAIAFFLLSSGLVSSAAAATKFEVATIPGDSKVSAAMFRIEIATGKVVNIWSSNVSTYSVISDAAPLPPGEYHLYASTAPQADGSVPWYMYRVEVNSGRSWALTGGGSTPFVWVEVQEPK